MKFIVNHLFSHTFSILFKNSTCQATSSSSSLHFSHCLRQWTLFSLVFHMKYIYAYMYKYMSPLILNGIIFGLDTLTYSFLSLSPPTFNCLFEIYSGQTHLYFNKGTIKIPNLLPLPNCYLIFEYVSHCVL